MNGIFFNQGHVCCAGSRLLVQEPVFDAADRQAQGAAPDAAGGRPARQEHRRRRDQLAGAARRRSRSWSPPASRRARRSISRTCDAARARVLVPAHAVHRRLAVAPDRARGDLRARAVDPHVPHAGGGRREGEQHARTGCRAGCLDREGLAHPVDGRSGLRAGVVWANTFNRFDPTSPFGGYKESGFGREGGLHGLEPYLTLRRGGVDERRARAGRAHREAVHRRGVPAERVAAGPTRCSRTTDVRSRTPRRPRARTCATRSWPRAPRSRAGPGMTAYNRGQILYRVAELMEGRRSQFARRARGRRGGRSRARRRRRDRSMGLVRGLGGQDRAGRRRVRTRSPGPYFNFTLPGAHGRGRASWRRRTSRCWGWSRGWRLRSSAATPPWCSRARRSPLPAVSLAEVLATSATSPAAS